MNLAEAILESMSEIDERYLEESEGERKRFFFLKPAFGVLAVCALVIFVSVHVYPLTENVAMNSTSSELAEEISADSLDTAEGSSCYEEDELTEMKTAMIDGELMKELYQLNDEDTVWVQVDVIQTSAEALSDVQSAYFPDDAVYGENTIVVQMTKQQILSFAGDPDTVYTFHLIQEDEIH